jgi:hypothetical protein
MAEAHHTCKSCSNQFSGSFCNVCGEKVLTPADKSFKTILNSVMLTITFADSKFIRTLWQVLRRPGTVARDFAAGKRVRNISPMSLFFVLNLIYFFFPLIQLFNASLNTQLMSPFSEFYKTLIATKAVSLGVDVNAFAMLYNLKTATLAKLMVMVFVVISSLPLNFLYWKKNKFFMDHVGYAVELASFNLFLNAILLTIIVRLFGLGRLLRRNYSHHNFHFYQSIFCITKQLYFLRERSWRLVLKSVILILFLKVALEIYRSVLFFITILMM